jgi:hypothetical protein
VATLFFVKNLHPGKELLRVNQVLLRPRWPTPIYKSQNKLKLRQHLHVVHVNAALILVCFDIRQLLILLTKLTEKQFCHKRRTKKNEVLCGLGQFMVVNVEQKFYFEEI